MRHDEKVLLLFILSEGVGFHFGPRPCAPSKDPPPCVEAQPRPTASALEDVMCLGCATAR